MSEIILTGADVPLILSSTELFDGGRVEEYLESIKQDLPLSPDWFGCTTATASFIAREALGIKESPERIDAAVGRQPGTASAGFKIAQWLFLHGLSADFYIGARHPFDDSQDSFAHEKISIEELISEYENYYGPVSNNYLKVFTDYYDNDVKPFILKRDEILKPSRDSGKIKEYEVASFDEVVLQQVFKHNVYVYAEVMSDGAASSHAVCLYRPESGFPLLVFTPDEDVSTVKLVGRDLLTDVFHANAVIGAWRACDD